MYVTKSLNKTFIHPETRTVAESVPTDRARSAVWPQLRGEMEERWRKLQVLHPAAVVVAAAAACPSAKRQTAELVSAAFPSSFFLASPQ